MGQKGGFKNIKLGKNVYRQVKRRGQQEYRPPKPPQPRPPKKASSRQSCVFARLR